MTNEMRTLITMLEEEIKTLRGQAAFYEDDAKEARENLDAEKYLEIRSKMMPYEETADTLEAMINVFK